MASRVLFASALCATLGLSAIASADPSAAEKDTARGLMSEGRADRDKGDLKGALAAFLGADAIMHVPTTGVEVAKTQAALGLLVEARDTALRVSHLASKPADPPPFKVAREVAVTLTGDLDARIPSVTVTVKNVPAGVAAEVTIDDAAVTAEELPQPRKLDPGHHRVIARAGGSEGKQEVDLGEKDRKEVTIDLPGAVAAGPATEAGGALASPADADGGASGRSGLSKALMVGGFGLAGAGLVVGSVAGILSLSKTQGIKSSTGCVGSVCGPTEYGDIASARSMATVATVSFIAAGAGALVGVLGLVTGPSSSPAGATPERAAPGETTSRAEPWLGVGAAGLRGTF
jgi:hypothetical protein